MVEATTATSVGVFLGTGGVTTPSTRPVSRFPNTWGNCMSDRQADRNRNNEFLHYYPSISLRCYRMDYYYLVSGAENHAAADRLLILFS